VVFDGFVLFLSECGTATDPTGIEEAVCTATGPVGLLIIAVYSFLIAFVLPLPSEVVLAPSGTLRLGLSEPATIVVIIVVSGAGKALGSLFAFHIGQETKEYGPLLSLIERSRFDILEWSEAKTVTIAKKYGYAGLALALCVPFFPDTLSIYAFSILEDDYVKFATATFFGSAGRLVVTVGLAVGFFAVV
jgi:membrane protein YqaA with SNARE-associated domain